MNPFLITFLQSPNEKTAMFSEKILKKDEILRIADTGKFKIGNGVSKFIDLEYSTTLPKSMFFQDADGIIEKIMVDTNTTI